MTIGPFSLSMESEVGGKIRRLEHGAVSRNLLFDPPHPYVVREKECVDFLVTGWDELCPTVAASSGVPSFGPFRLAPYETSRDTACLKTTWQVPELTMKRAMHAQGNTLSATYHFSNLSEEAIPFLWASHLLFPVERLQRAVLPKGPLVAGPGCDLTDLDRVIHRSEEKTIIDTFTETGESWKFFVPATNPVVLEYDDCRITLFTDTGWFGVFHNRGRFGQPCLGVEPTTAPTDYAHDAALMDGMDTIRTQWRLAVE